MYIIIVFMVVAFMLVAGVASFALTRKMQEKVVSDSSPFSFADDVLIINTGPIFSVQSTNIECIELHYNPKALQNKFYEMKIHIVKTDGSVKKILYRGRRNGTQPQDMAAALRARHIQCDFKD